MLDSIVLLLRRSSKIRKVPKIHVLEVKGFLNQFSVCFGIIISMEPDQM